MKKYMVITILSLIIFNCQLSILNCQTWQELMDSTKFYQELPDYNTALQWALKAEVKAKEQFGELDTNYTTSLGLIYSCYYYLGNAEKTIEYCKKSRQLIKEVLGIESREYAQTIGNLGLFYDVIALYTEAEPLYNESLVITRRLYKDYHPDLITRINNMAMFYNARGNFKQAKPLFKEALDMARHLYKGVHPDLALSINNMAYFYFGKGNYTEAEPLFKEALEITRRLYKGVHPDLASNVNNLATLYYSRGKYAEAEPLFKEALEITRRLYKGDHPDLANSIKNNAIFFIERGAYKEAEPLFKEALDMYRRLFKGDHPDLANSINIMANFYDSRGTFDEAEPLFKEALEMRRRIFKGGHPDLANSISSMANFFNGRGAHREAEPLYKEALNMYRNIFKGDHPDLAISINNTARFYDGRSNDKEAEPLYKEALDMRRRLFNDNHPDLARGINNMAGFYDSRGNYTKAEPLFKEGLQVSMNILNNYFPSLSEKEKNLFWSTVSGRFEGFNTFAVHRVQENPGIIGDVYDIQLYSKAMLLNTSNKIKNRILNSGDSSLILSYQRWSDMKELLVKLNKMSNYELKKKNIIIDSIENEANELEKQISLKSEVFKQGYEKKKVTWRLIKDKLKSNEAVMEAVRFRFYKKLFTDTVYYAVLIIKKNSPNPELVLLKNGNDLEGKYIDLYRNQINQQRKQVYDPEKIETNLTELYKQFWASIQEKLKGIKTVYLSPDGVYNQINLNTLINPKTGKYLLEEIDLRIVTSTRDLISANGQQSTVNESTAVLFGDPQFNLNSTKYTEIASRYVGDRSREYYYMGTNLDTLLRQGISSLPGTRKEIDKISSNMKASKWDVKTFLGPDAIEEAIKAVKSPKVLHIATHGKFLKDIEIKEERSFGMETQRYVENPLLRSMLLFAGAENTIFRTSNPALSQTEDGLLTAYEAMNLNLDNTELVVLSACETGLGEVKNGEGVYGLQRAFQVAGAKSLIMSLWSVSDEATQELMTTFYDNWLSGRTKREAFRDAQIELKKKYPGFYYWGAFVMVGE